MAAASRARSPTPPTASASRTSSATSKCRRARAIILRTAGASRTKAEVKRDFEYLQRLWESVRTLTLKSTAPCLVYEEGSLIKRTIRDLYSKDIDELLVAGDDAYREAKDFMRMIMPSHAKNVQLYKDDQPLFSKFNVEGQLDQMFSPQVTLPSGGYIVINPTEALVSIDVNSGRSTKEHNIEDTALQTNLEAADEVARQLRLRDLAGLIVIDFIDMIENRSNRAVERRLKDALKNDRARIQVGRISHFGLMEMSRQRIRFGVVESSTHKCPTCNGTGLVRSVESVALMVMRNVEDHVLRKRPASRSMCKRADRRRALHPQRQAQHARHARGSSTACRSPSSPTTMSARSTTSSRRARPGSPPATSRRRQHVRVDTAANRRSRRRRCGDRGRGRRRNRGAASASPRGALRRRWRARRPPPPPPPWRARPRRSRRPSAASAAAAVQPPKARPTEADELVKTARDERSRRKPMAGAPRRRERRTPPPPPWPPWWPPQPPR